MKILNKKKLVESACNARERRVRELVLSALEEGVRAVNPHSLVAGSVFFKNGAVFVNGKRFFGRRIFVIGAGKASGAMVEALERIVPVHEGIVSVPCGTARRIRVKKTRLIECRHPIPWRRSVLAAKKILSLANRVRENDLVIFLVSGGGSALLCLPAKGLRLKEKQAVIGSLLKRGADINELNCVRKHLSAVKGGRLAQAFHCPMVCLILSDVLENPLDVIASGPAVPDKSTVADAKKILRKYGLYKGRLKTLFEKKLVEETPKKRFPHVHAIVLGDNNIALNAARGYLEARGIHAKVLRGVRGEARAVGKKFAELLNRGISFVAGGETIVRVKGKGVGGRNQEFVLSAALALKKPGVVASMGTDGIDGTSKAAGALACNQTIGLAKKKGLNAREFLENNDSNSFFKKAGGEILTGLTGTNVCDLMIGLPLNKQRTAMQTTMPTPR